MVSLIIRHIWVTIKIVESVLGQLRKIIDISTTTLSSPYMIKQYYQLFVDLFNEFARKTIIDIDEITCYD